MEDNQTLEVDEELRAEMSSADINDLDDKDFAYIEPGGEKDDEGKTVPRSLRHFPINDEAHVRNALARLSQSPFGDKAKAKVFAAAKKMGIEVADDTESKADDAPVVKRKRERHRAVPLVPELRHFTAANLEVREAKDTDEFVLRGTPIVYSTSYDVYDVFGKFSERIEPGAVTDVLSRGADVRMLFDHSGLPLARTVSGTMSLTDTPTGLNFEARLDPRQQLANDLYLAVSRGDVSAMSIGMRVSSDTWDDAMENRTIHKIEDLLDVSAVTYPASPTTSIEIAQRMAMMMPLESAARTRKFYVDSRAGKKMSASNASMVLEALHTLHTALGEAGAAVDAPEDDGAGETNADALTPSDGTVSTVEPVNENDDQNIDLPFTSEFMDDGSEGGNVLGGAGEGYPGFADGSGLRSVPSTKEERATASMSFGDQQSAVYQALLGVLGDGDGDCDLWVCDLGDDWVVFESYVGDMGMWRCGYSCDADGNVSFTGDPVRVSLHTEYVPVDQPVVAVSVSAVVGRSARDLRLAMEARKRRRI